MAYKFQLGAFTASGSIKAEEGFDANDQNITNVGSLRADDIRPDNVQLTVTMADNQSEAFKVQEGSNAYMSFDTSDGAEKIDVVQNLKITDDKKLIFGTNSDASFEYDEDGNNVLLYAGANIRIPDDTKIEFGAAGDAGIEYDENGTDQLRIHAATAGLAVELGGGTAFSIDSSGNATFAGNLTVQGETTTVDSTTINISSSFTFEGPADDHETVLSAGSPGADSTLTLPTLSAGSYFIPALADAATDASAAVTAAEFALLDGGSTVGTSGLADSDGFMHNDGGTMKQTQVLKIAELAFSKVSGDATVASNGALTIANDAVEQAMIADDAVGADQLASNAVVNASIASNAAIDIDKLDGGSCAASLSDLAQGDLLYAGDVDASNAIKSITFSNLEDAIFGNISGDATIAAGGALTIAAGAVEHGMLAEDIISGQDELAHADIADADELMISDAGTIKRVGVDSLRDHYYGSISGDATVADGGALTIAADAVESGMLNDNVISGQTELAAGGVADADELLISDGGVLKRIGVDSFRGYVNAGSTPTSFGDADATLVVGVNFASANTSAARTLTLPASPAVGQSVKVKVAGVSSGAVTITRAGSQTIDGSLTSIVLESDSAAVELIYVASDDWRVF